MKIRKEIISLLVAVIVVAGMIGALAWQRNREPEPEDDTPAVTSGAHLLQRTEAEVVSVTFQTQEKTTVMLPFIDENDRREWMWEGVDYVLDTVNARHKVRGAFSLFANQVVHDDIADAGINLADFGFNPPYMTITTLYDDNSTSTLHLGSLTIDLAGRFVTMEGSTGLYTISRLNAERLMFGLEDLIERELPIWDAETMQHMLIAQRNHDTIEFKIEEHPEFEGHYWLLMQQPFPGREVYAMSFEYHVLERFDGFMLGDLVNVHPANFAAYGLDNPSLEFMFRSHHGEAHLLFGDVFFRDVNGEETAFIYVQFAGRPHVFEALYEPVTALLDVNVLRFIERFIALLNIQEVQQMEVLTPDGNFEIWINQVEDSTDIAPTINDIPVDEADFRLLYRLVIGLGIDGEIEPFAPAGTPLYTVRYILFDGDDVEIHFFDYSEAFLAVSLNNEDIWVVTNRRNFDLFTGRLNLMVQAD
ncbi:MAG: DUF4340 domain-containing protein [Defluviitaleaceae bacterium]|nr:DUF4340 domain-containing protein [Defluviitaleaceae bacterium]